MAAVEQGEQSRHAEKDKDLEEKTRLSLCS